MSTPRPYERDSFYPPALFTYQMKINLCIYTKLLQLFLPYGIYVLSWNGTHLRFTHAPFKKPLLHVSNLLGQPAHNPHKCSFEYLTKRARHAIARREKSFSCSPLACLEQRVKNCNERSHNACCTR